MRTKASIESHPIHPALVVYPIAFLHSTFALDLIGRLSGRQGFHRLASRLGIAGLGSAILAAIPGAIDYIYTVPPESSAKGRARRHILVNTTALGLFGLAQWLRRRRDDRVPGALTLGIEAVGTGFLAVGAWLGSTLVHRNMIGPDHRQAEAGRSREERIPYWPGEAVAVARVDELEVDQMKLLKVGGERIVLGRTEEGYVAFDDRCTHRGGSLADGVMICGTVQCLWHGSQFDVLSGEVEAGPAELPLRTYQVEVAEDDVLLVLPEEGRADPLEVRKGQWPADTLRERDELGRKGIG